jgi:hypothetical protein
MNKKLRKAYVEVIVPLKEKLENCEFGDDTDKTSTEHLIWMCEYCLENLETMPIDKLSRWVGFVQGIMAANKVLDVDEERNRTRPIFLNLNKQT